MEAQVNTVQVGEVFAITLERAPAPGELVVVGITTDESGKVTGAASFVPRSIVSVAGAMESVIKSVAEELEIEFSVPQA